jgi:hypothetical protein
MPKIADINKLLKEKGLSLDGTKKEKLALLSEYDKMSLGQESEAPEEPEEPETPVAKRVRSRKQIVSGKLRQGAIKSLKEQGVPHSEAKRVKLKDLDKDTLMSLAKDLDLEEETRNFYFNEDTDSK